MLFMRDLTNSTSDFDYSTKSYQMIFLEVIVQKLQDYVIMTRDSCKGVSDLLYKITREIIAKAIWSLLMGSDELLDGF